MSDDASIARTTPDSGSAYRRFALGFLSLLSVVAVTLVILLGIQNLLVDMYRFERATLLTGLEFANEYCAVSPDKVTEPLSEDWDKWPADMRPTPSLLAARDAWYDADDAFLNIKHYHTIDHVFAPLSMGPNPIFEYIPPKTPRPELWKGEAADFEGGTLEMDAAFLAIDALDVISSTNTYLLLEHFDEFGSAEDILTRLSVTGNCVWTLSRSRQPDILTLIGHLFLAASDIWDLGPLGRYSWFDSQLYFDSWRGNFILTFTNTTVEDPDNPDGMSILIPIAPGTEFIAIAVKVALVGWAAVVAALGMLFVWIILRPFRVLGRASMEAGSILRADDDVPGRLTNLASSLPPRWPGVGDYRNLLQEFSSLLEEREFWLGSMLHHVKNDLQAIILGLSQIRDVPDDLERVFPDIDKATGCLQSKLNNVATYQWTQFGAPEKAELIDLGSLVETIVDDIVDAGGNAAIAAYDDVYVVARKEALESALQNLFWNAHHHGGVVEVGIEFRQETKTVEIEIDDDGPGIPEEEMEEVFKPYRKVGERSEWTRTGFVGAGLGLSIARRVITDHGGDISLENRRSADGGIEGLRVRVALPLNGPVTAETGG